MHTLKNLAVAAAMVALVASAQAEYYPGSTDFEGESPLTDACWSNVVEAAIVADASVADVPQSPNLPPSFDKTSRANVLSFDTDDPIVRYLQSGHTAPSASTIYAAPADETVAQSVTATFSPDDVSAKFFKAKIEFPHPEGDPDDLGEEPEPDPEE